MRDMKQKPSNLLCTDNCRASDGFGVLTISGFAVQDMDKYGISIYPNPSNGSFNIISIVLLKMVLL